MKRVIAPNVTGVATAISVFVGLSGQVSAQDAAQPLTTGLGERLNGGVVVTEVINDNIFSTRAQKETDFITVIAPWLDLSLGDSDARVTLGASAEIGAYAENSSEDYQDYRFYADGRYRIAPGFLLFGNVSHEHEHEDRGSPDDVNGTRPTEYDATRAIAAVLKRFGQTSVKLGATYAHYDFDDTGPINNDDRDREHLTAGARVEHSLNNATRIFGEFTYDTRQYRLALDDNGFNRDSDGIRAIAGVSHRFAPGLDGQLYAGWIYQDYEDGLLRNVSTPDVGGRLNWRPADGTSVLFRAERTVEETTVNGASSYVRTALSFGWRQWLDQDLRADAGASYSVNDYWGLQRTDHVFGLNLDLRKYLTPHLFVGAGYAFEGRQSNDIIQNYDQSKFMVRFGAELQPAYSETQQAAQALGTSSDGGPGAFYLGVQTGLATIGTDLEGPRGAGGSLQSDFADHGVAGSLFAGYSRDVSNWYLGLEGDVSIADADWDHARLPGGRVFAVDRDWAFGLSGILGQRLMGGALLYGRAGLVVAEFDTTYRTSSGRRFDGKQTELGLRFGIGGHVPVSRDVSVRMEYDYTSFDDYDVTVPSSTDTFANSQSTMWLGAAYHLQDQTVPEHGSQPARFDGFYAGVQAGHGQLLSNDLSGPRMAGSTLIADFGDAGFSGGMFAGYNAQFEQFVVGVEADAEISDAIWDHEREPTGRSFSLDKQYSIGASLRAGYVLGSAGLLYARAGLVHSDLKYNFRRGATSVSVSDGELGWRVGLGMELPVMEQVNVRLDFSHTDYGNKSVLIPGADNGAERFDVSENLFRLGAIYRF